MNNNGSPPSPLPYKPVEVRLVGLHDHGGDCWTVVIAVRGLADLEPLELAAASANLRDRLLSDPPVFFKAAGWGDLSAPVPRKEDEVEVVVLLVGDFDSVLFED